MRYFITGATGFIGGTLSRRLIADGHQVVALVRSPGKAKELSKLGAEIYPGDILEIESMREPMEGCDGVFHVAGWYKVGVKDKSPARKINIEGTRNVLSMMKELGIPKGVYTSSLATFSDTGGKEMEEGYRYEGEHLSEYDRTKWVAHHEVAVPMMEEGLPLVIVMPGAVYGLGDTSQLGDNIRQYLQGKLPMLPQESAVCWSHVDDVVEGHVLAMQKGKPGEEYIIAGPCHTFIEAFNIAEELTGISAPPLRIPPAVISLMAKVMGVFGKVIPLPDIYSSESLHVLAGVTYLGSNQKAKEELGFEPRSLREGLKETLPEMQKNLKNRS